MFLRQLKYLVCVSLALTISGGLFAQTTVKLATVAPEGSPWANELAKIKKKIESESQGQIKFKIYPGGQMGGENEILQQVIRGKLQGAGLTAGALANTVKELNVLEIPYLFNSYAQADCVLDDHLQEDFRKLFEAKGLIFVTWAENGYRSIGTKSAPVKTPEDLKGVKIRIQESPVHIAYWKQLGVSGIPIAIPEVLPSLQTGVVEGFDNTPLFTLAAEWQTAIKYFTLTRHIYQPAAILYSKKFWDTLNDDQKKTLMGEGNKLAPGARQAVRSIEKNMIATLKKADVVVYEPSSSDLAGFKSAAAAVSGQVVGKIGGQSKQIYDKIQKAKAACGG
ncbi:C4-dicarboxylate ABC transporter substrate-binding protein [Leptospira congkakensis]|uniref:C4-dicarboxylate ABC transporter substrate-binding protein n=1 Tax=Leptospira congkakensis TaxID=2484932 RepID=A0A4Z1AI25_9LEPT|nr:TRAP transporter substrate-binding protein DctP [Leptospira congkakensis]TGL90747.1 C4-dicarboxylate ABC transporter substrate-binding protein [Leptospira congkakensis]TGL91754.1 C4-dicarboxylate ABC transporter substrate-binding protein [Leptospira congkakensis]TGL98808.1 C4-dicarboxylate ABC transporter substrate-binding protein [Leptospira congkakensis]